MRNHTMWRPAILLASIVVCLSCNVSAGNCETKCHSRSGQLSNKCADDISPITRAVSLSSVCYQQDTCFPDSGGDTTSVPVQQYPLYVLLHQEVNFKIKDFTFYNFTLKLLTSTLYDHFVTCNESESTLLRYSSISNDTIRIPPLGAGVHYLIFESNHVLYTCALGFRLQLTVFEHSCGFNSNSTTNSCSSKGECLLNGTTNVYKCSCCEGYTGQICEEFDGCLDGATNTTTLCSNNGVCSDIVNGSHPGYQCSCNDRYTGDNCEQCMPGFAGQLCTDINECNQTNAKPCNFGQCVNLNGSFSCFCPVNVTGTLCDIDLYDNCFSSPCNNSNATCVDKYNGFECRCPVDFTGKHCELRIDNCQDNDCTPEGTTSCIDSVETYTCACVSGYTGVYCENNINDCQNDTCINGGICVDLLNAYQCHCLPGYDGDRCQNIANKCDVMVPCRNNGTCIRSGSNLRDYKCECVIGFEGLNCTKMTNKCRTLFPCQNNAACSFRFNDYVCDCPLGWVDKNCSTNFDACQDEPCANNSTCLDSHIGHDYTCVCPVGFTDQNCSTNINDCVNVTCNNGLCIDGINDSHCQCNSGWFGRHCNVDTDYCASAPCLNAVKCENVLYPPGAKCTCKAGFTGVYCVQNIDDCISNQCLNGAVCEDFVNAYNCTCPPGFEGEFCGTDINECAVNPCQNNATCQDLTNQYFCKCLPGYSGVNCQIDIDDCASNPCQNNASCSDRINNFTCSCAPGFVGLDCGIHRCSLKNSTCLNGASCQRVPSGFNCVCGKEFEGLNCESSVNECLSFPCQHNGTCLELHKGYECQCRFPYNGTACEKHVCSTKVCENNATCIVSDTDFKCDCKPGFTGSKCETEIDECQNNLCHQNGTKECIDKANKFECSCFPAYSGTFCQNHQCDLNTGMCNNGTCIKGESGYNCSCFPGFNGTHCDQNIQECATNACRNNGTCIDGVNNFTCSCQHPWTGHYCEVATNICLSSPSSPCMNNAICLFDPSTAAITCNCTFPFSGAHCEHHICDISVPCGNNGTCIASQHGYRCSCDSGFTSDDCSIDVNECNATNTCRNNASCVNTLGSYRCVCSSRYTGENCESKVDYCGLNNNTCSNAGVCTNDFQNSRLQCICESGYTGDRCQTKLTMCYNQTCSSKGHCVDDGVNGTSYTCQCQLGYHGRDCQHFKCPCQSSGRCVRHNISDPFTCLCELGYSGALCDEFFGDCRMNVSMKCSLNSYCQSTEFGYACVCPPHLQGDQCSKPGGCSYQPCQNNGSCSSQQSSGGGYVCNCRSGYTGRQCQYDVNECSSSPCFNQGQCFEEGVGGYRCRCSADHYGTQCEHSFGGNQTASPSALVYTTMVDGGQKKTNSASSSVFAYTTTVDGGQMKTTDNIVYFSSTVGAVLPSSGILPSFSSSPILLPKTSSFDETTSGTVDLHSYVPPTTNLSAMTNILKSTVDIITTHRLGNSEFNTHDVVSFLESSTESPIKRLSSTSLYSSQVIHTVLLSSAQSSILDLPMTTAIAESATVAVMSPIASTVLLSTESSIELKINYTVQRYFSSEYQIINTSDINRSASSATATLPTVNTTRYSGSIAGQRSSSVYLDSSILVPNTKSSMTTTIASTLSTDKLSSSSTNEESSNSFTESSVANPQTSAGISQNATVAPMSPTPILSISKLSTALGQGNSNSIHSSISVPNQQTISAAKNTTATLISPAPTLSSFKHPRSTAYEQSTNLSNLQSSSTLENIYSSSDLRMETSALVLPSTSITSNASQITSTMESALHNSISTVSSPVHVTNVTPTESTYISPTSLSSTPSLTETSNATKMTQSMGSFSTKEMTSRSTSYPKEISSIIFTHSASPNSIILQSTTPSPPTTTQRPYMNLTCADEPCNGFPCVNQTDNGLTFRCQCPFPTVAPRCSLASMIHYPRFSGYSYLEIPPISLDAKKDSIALLFHTSQPDGLLLHAKNDQYEDHIELYVQNGRFVVSLSTGAMVTKVTSRYRVDTGKTIVANVRLDIRTRLVTLSINDNDVASTSILSSLKSIQLNSPWFLGGTPDDVVQKNPIPKFSGCIQELTVNGKPYQLADPTYARNWTNIGDCDVSLCERNVCKNNATCTPDYTNLENYHCQCDTGFHGRTCQDKLVDYCAGDECNGGMCVWTANGRKCLCQYGRIGENCLIDTVIVSPRFSTFMSFSSYIEYPWLQTGRYAKERFEIRLQFHISNSSTSLKNSLLVYLAQSTVGAPGDDFFAVGMINSHIQLMFNLGSGATLLRSKKPVDTSRNWHFLVAGRTTQHGYLYVDSQEKVEMSSGGRTSSLDVYTPLYVGGVPDFNTLPPSLRTYFHQGFNGLIQDVAFRSNGVAYTPLLTLTKSQCSSDMVGIPAEAGLNIANDGQQNCKEVVCANNGKCVDSGTGFSCQCVPPYKGVLCHDRDVMCVDYNPCNAGSTCQSDGFSLLCDCPFGKHGHFCEKDSNITVPSFLDNSYLSLTPPATVNIRSACIVNIRFKADSGNGLLFYTAHSMDEGATGDFLAISVWQRYVYVKFNLGTHTASMRTRQKITLQKWHTFYLRREAKDAIMRLDDNYVIGVRSSGSMTMLDVSTNFFVGGVPLLSGINSQALKDVQSQHDFTGCIDYLKVNDQDFDLSSNNPFINGRNIMECGASCLQSTCHNGAPCSPKQNTTTTTTTTTLLPYSCDCPVGFIGPLCNREISNITSAKFSSTSYWFTRKASFSTSYYSHIQLNFQTRDSEGLIFWNGRLKDSSSDWLGVGLWQGKLKVAFSLDGTEVSGMSQFSYNDGKPHKLVLSRIGNIIQFFVNGHTPQIIRNVQIKESMTTDGHIYVGGFPGNVSSLTGGRFVAGFTGCISSLTLNEEPKIIDFASVKSSVSNNADKC